MLRIISSAFRPHSHFSQVPRILIRISRTWEIGIQQPKADKFFDAPSDHRFHWQPIIPKKAGLARATLP
jgi:hypothetical protein